MLSAPGLEVPLVVRISGDIQVDLKFTQPIPYTCSVYREINYIKIGQQGNSVIFRVGNVPRVRKCKHLLFPSCLIKPGKGFLCHGKTRYCRFGWYRMIR